MLLLLGIVIINISTNSHPLHFSSPPAPINRNSLLSPQSLLLIYSFSFSLQYHFVQFHLLLIFASSSLLFLLMKRPLPLLFIISQLISSDHLGLPEIYFVSVLINAYRNLSANSPSFISQLRDLKLTLRSQCTVLPKQFEQLNVVLKNSPGLKCISAKRSELYL